MNRGPCSRDDEGASTLQALVDDIAMNREIAGSLLRMVGHDVRYAACGAEAVAAAIIGDIDVILMDVRMPDVDGFEATRRIRALGNERGKVAILGLTAQAFSDQITDYLQAGMTFYQVHLSRTCQTYCKQFFFEKKNQKTFVMMTCDAGKTRDSDVKVFCFFSSEKKALLAMSLVQADLVLSD